MTGRANNPQDHRVQLDDPHVGRQAARGNQLSAYLTTAEVAQRYRAAESTVRYWRTLDPPYGPRGALVGRRVLYPIAEVERFDRAIAAVAAAGQSARAATSTPR